MINELKYCGFKTIADVSEALKKREGFVKKFGEGWLNRHNEKEAGMLGHGISLFYLVYSVVCESEKELEVHEYLDDANIGTSDEREGIAKELLAMFKEKKKEKRKKFRGRIPN